MKKLAKKSVKILLVSGSAWLLIACAVGGTLGETWALLKSKNHDQAADELDAFAKATYLKPVLGIFDNMKAFYSEKYKN